MKDLIIICDIEKSRKEILYETGNIPILLYSFGGYEVIDLQVQLYEKLSPKNNIYVLLTRHGEKEIKSHIEATKQKFNVTDFTQLNIKSGEDIIYGIRKILLSKNNTERFSKIFINFSDTVPLMADIDIIHKNALYFNVKKEPYQWETIETNKGVIKKIKPKNNLLLEKVITGLFKFSNLKKFNQILLEKNSFNDFILEYFQNTAYSFRKLKGVFGFRHLKQYYDYKSDKTDRRVFNNIEINKKIGTFTKSSRKKEKIIGEINWYLKLPDNLKYFIPKVYNYSFNGENPCVTLEYYGYQSLSEIFLYRGYSKAAWFTIFERLKKILKELHNYTIDLSEKEKTDILNEMYIKKTKKRLLELLKQEEFKNLAGRKIYINGKQYKPIEEYFPDIEKIVKKVLIKDIPFTIIHGDYCLSNILYTPKGSIVKLVDPRGTFGKLAIYGDPRYDLAKLQHSFLGYYEFIVHNKFVISKKRNHIQYEVKVNSAQKDISKIYKTAFKHMDFYLKKEIDLLEALLFLSMIPLHRDYPERQLVMLGYGLSKLGVIIRSY